MDSTSPATPVKQQPEPSIPRRSAEQPRGGAASTFIGRHRLTAAITHLQNQINTLQEELQELEAIGDSSLVCKGFIPSVESTPDPLLPVTKGPVDASWDCWFRGEHSSRRHKRWI